MCDFASSFCVSVCLRLQGRSRDLGAAKSNQLARDLGKNLVVSDAWIMVVLLS